MTVLSYIALKNDISSAYVGNKCVLCDIKESLKFKFILQAFI